MPCDTYQKEGQTPQQRKAQIQDALGRLEAALQAGTVKVTVGPQGAVAFAGWKLEDREGVTDLCAFRKLTVAKSWALKQAVMKAEVLAGRKVDPRQVEAGTHSHDGGHHWDKGH